MFLYEKMDVRREDGNIKELPQCVERNLNPNFELRKYQREAFENFITHFESKTRPRPLQVLFHMATGSGKTLIMAGLILYLYTRGYRNFLFFVNLSNIVDKTRDNFLNPASKKYLFAEEINLDGERVHLNVTENFRYADPDAINICFSTTQGLHDKIQFPQENSMTLNDFDECKVVLISDEAHHLNASTKKLSLVEQTWEQTIEHIFKRNAENILLEFTATCDVTNPAIRCKYEDKIIFDYTLQKFYDERYSKEIISLRSDSDSRVLNALILSQYRLKVFGDNNLNIKPVVLFKAAQKITESENFMAKFIADVKNLRGEKLRELSEQSNGIIRQAFDYFARKNISFDDLAAELREDFSGAHCLSANSLDATDNRINSLEEPGNPYRAIFEVKKLDEGWDVLNLFDIVRMYETRQSGGKKISSATVSEAQLIGRGARYCPFRLDDEQPKYQRKFDDDITNDLRICETLYYHCQNDSRYISELHRALHEIGLDIEQGKQCSYVLKESFKRDALYTHGKIFLNGRMEVTPENLIEHAPELCGKSYSFRAADNVGSDKLMSAQVESVDEKISTSVTHMTVKEIAEINYAIVHKALRKNKTYNFDALKKIFPKLTSTRQFLTDENYLGGVKIYITGAEVEPSVATIYAAVVEVLNKIAETLDATEKHYRGTTKFRAEEIKNIFRDKTINYAETHAEGLGVSQNDSSIAAEFKIDLSAEDWFAYEDNFGTSEEKAFVAYFRERVGELKKIYDKIFLVRNERACKIYSFADGRHFEPDYVLFLQKNRGGDFEHLQIFIEPKGKHLTEHDGWKEDFLRELNAKVLIDDERCKIFGLPFFNRDDKEKFDSEFDKLLE